MPGHCLAELGEAATVMSMTKSSQVIGFIDLNSWVDRYQTGQA